MDLEILYEDKYLLAVNKPGGVGSVPGPHVRMDVIGELGKPDYFVLHRLDFYTTGVQLIGKQKAYRKTLEAILGAPNTVKRYIALIKGIPEPRKGTIKKKLEARYVEKYVNAVTDYNVLKAFENVSLVEIFIKTGRWHQIRLHFAMIGHPVVNDKEHGDFGWNKKFQRRNKTKRLLLHADSIEFDHPFLKKHMKITAPLPEYFSQAIDNLKPYTNLPAKR